MQKKKTNEFKIESKPGAGAGGASAEPDGGVVDPPVAPAPPAAAPGLNIDDTKFDILLLLRQNI